MGSSLLSAFGYDPGFAKYSPTEEGKATRDGDVSENSEYFKVEKEKEESAAQGSFFS